MQIGEAAKRGNCTVETVRYYEQQGLIDPAGRAPNGYRIYSEAHVVQLNFVRHCRSLQMTLPEIKTLHDFQSIPESDCEKISQLVGQQIEKIHQQIGSLRKLEQQLSNLHRSCRSNHQVADCGIMRNLVQAAEGHHCTCHAEAST